MVARKKISIAAAVALLVVYAVLKVLQRRGAPQKLPPTAEKLTSPAPAAFDPQQVKQEPPKAKRLGYLIALKYYEQQTQATKNFLQMQCLASNYSMQVVEPFISKSQLTFSLSQGQKEQMPLRLGDLIDMGLWNQQAVGRYGYPPVASWEDFLANAPRNVVLVCVKCRDPPRIKIPKPGSNFRLGCSDDCFDKFNSTLSFLSEYHFRLVRKACANFVAYAGSVTSEDFLRNILLESRYRREDVTVILSEFRGFFGLYRMQILSPCGLITHADIKRNLQIMPSQRLVQEARKYSEMNFGKRPYISVLVRVEKIVLHSLLNITKCADEVVSVLERFDVQEYFLAMDVGRYGSSGSILHDLQPHGEQLFRRVYGDRWTFEQWEESFTRASSSNNPAYVANLQRTLAAMGRCLLMVGAGGFQAQARNLYEKYHPEASSRCVYKICAG